MNEAYLSSKTGLFRFRSEVVANLTAYLESIHGVLLMLVACNCIKRISHSDLCINDMMVPSPRFDFAHVCFVSRIESVQCIHVDENIKEKHDFSMMKYTLFKYLI